MVHSVTIVNSKTRKSVCTLLDWPPRSPDLDSLRFFLVGLRQRQSLSPSYASKTAIQEAVQSITREMLQSACAELGYRLDIC